MVENRGASKIVQLQTSCSCTKASTFSVPFPRTFSISGHYKSFYFERWMVLSQTHLLTVMKFSHLVDNDLGMPKQRLVL